MEKSVDDFATLEDALIYFGRLGFLPIQVKTETWRCSSIGQSGGL